MVTAVIPQQRLDGDPALGNNAPDRELFRDIALGAPAMLWVSNEHGAMVFQNEQYLRFAGMSAAQAVAPDSWINIVHPDDRRPAMSAYTAALREHRSFTVEYRLRQHDGCYRHVVDRAHPRYDAVGTFRGYIGATLDITDRKRQEEALLASTAAIENRSLELNLLYELKSDLQVCRSIEETRPVLLHYGDELFSKRAARIYLRNNSRDLVEPFLSWNSALGAADPFAPTECWALRKGKVHIEQQALGANPIICPNGARCARAAYMCTPMTVFGETIGVLQVDIEDIEDRVTLNNKPERITDLERISRLAGDEIGTAIEELKLRASLRTQSTRDPLTSLFNRRYFTETLERELNRANQASRPLALLMLDLDHFKQFNDAHGHAGGDKVLREFAKVLKATVRGGDVACRYGGEEFAIIMPDCPPASALQRAEDIRAAVEQIASDFHGATISGITISVGAACFPNDAESVELLVSRADAALYAAKMSGRNRVVMHIAGSTGGRPAV